MRDDVKKKQRKAMIRDWALLGLVLAVTVALTLIFPENRERVTTTSWNFFIEMMSILPAVMIIMGLFAVWISKETVVKYLGRASGIRGIILSIILGALPAGPLYVAFPLAAVLLKKGASIHNIIILLSAWACIKIPQELVELQFLGVRFMLLRLFLTILFVVIMGISIEKIMERQGNRDKIGKEEVSGDGL